MGAERANLAIICYFRYFQCIKHSLVSSLLLRGQENTLMRLVFANTVPHKRAVVLNFELGCTESLLDFLSYQKYSIGPTVVGSKNNFQNKGSQMAGKRYLKR